MSLFLLKLPLNVFPFQQAYVKNDLLSIYIPPWWSCDQVLRQTVNYDKGHNKNSLSVDNLFPGFTGKFCLRVHLRSSFSPLLKAKVTSTQNILKTDTLFSVDL